MPTKLLALLPILLILTACTPTEAQLKNKAEQIALQIEAFQGENGRLPTSLTEIGEPETEAGPVYYRALNEKVFEIWYGESLGESSVWNSKTQKWKH